MNEIAVDGREVVAAGERIEELLAHPHQRRGAAGREIEPPQQLLPARLGRDVDACGGDVGSGSRARSRSRRRAARGRARISTRELSKKATREPGGQLRVARQDLAGERHARGFAAAGQELLAEIDQIGRTLLGRRPAVAGDERAAAICDRLQHVAEE